MGNLSEVRLNHFWQQRGEKMIGFLKKFIPNVNQNRSQVGGRWIRTTPPCYYYYNGVHLV